MCIYICIYIYTYIYTYVWVADKIILVKLNVTHKLGSSPIRFEGFVQPRKGQGEANICRLLIWKITIFLRFEHVDVQCVMILYSKWSSKSTVKLTQYMVYFQCHIINLYKSMIRWSRHCTSNCFWEHQCIFRSMCVVDSAPHLNSHYRGEVLSFLLRRRRAVNLLKEL